MHTLFAVVKVLVAEPQSTCWIPIERATKLFKLAIPGGFHNELHMVYYIGRVRLVKYMWDEADQADQYEYMVGRVCRRKCYVSFGKGIDIDIINITMTLVQSKVIN